MTGRYCLTIIASSPEYFWMSDTLQARCTPRQVDDEIGERQRHEGDAMRVRTSINVIVVCVLLTTLTALDLSRAGAQRLSRDSSTPLDRFIAEYAERLGLDQETLAAIRTIVESSRAQGEPLRTELRQAQAQMRTLLSQEVPNEAAVMQQADAIGALDLAIRKQRLQVMLRIRALLTPAQRQELMRLQETWQARRRPEIMQACQAESIDLCPDAAPGRPHLACLEEHMAELSMACRTAIQSRKGDGR
jgi:Spy/CpxP family protein refolding chaperone